jgi:glycosyltransferase involved in cell wall biosynthesis
VDRSAAQHAAAQHGAERTLYLITDAMLHPLAGNLSQWPSATPVRPGWISFPVEEHAGGVSEEHQALASVFVLPSVVEPFGIAALEAMAAGVPTIVSKTSGVAEMSQGTTFRVDFWDVEEFASRISELLEYPTLRAAMGDQGRWTALREGWPERARETVMVYVEAMQAGGNRS